MKRRNFVQNSSAMLAGVGLVGLAGCNTPVEQTNSVPVVPVKLTDSSGLFFKISLAEWSIHSQIRKGRIRHIDFAQKAKSFGVEALEYVSQLFPNIGYNDGLLKEMKTRAEGEGLVNHLIMIDHEGDLGISNEKYRLQAVDNHKKWIDAAAFLNCSSVRVNMEGDGSDEDIIGYGSESMKALAEYAQASNINVLIENHGGFSSNIDQLVKIFENVNMDNCGALPDFGNWCVKEEKEDNGAKQCVFEFDRYKGTEMLMPFAKGGVSAKTKKFNAEGNEKNSDYSRLLKTVKDANFSGYIGIEFESDHADEEDMGIQQTRELLIREGSKLS